MVKLAIFDLDGTLLDTLDDLANACNHALSRCGYPERKREEYRHFVGKGIMNLFRAAMPEDARNEENVKRMRDFFLPYYNEHKTDCTKPYQGITDMLDMLTASGISIAVASNKFQAGTEELVRRYFSRYGFAAVLGQREGKPIKPDAGIILEAMAALEDISKEEVIYCGDSNIDMETGINAGVRTIGVTWGFRSEDELKAYAPWMLADHPAQITAALMHDSE